MTHASHSPMSSRIIVNIPRPPEKTATRDAESEREDHHRDHVERDPQQVEAEPRAGEQARGDRARADHAGGGQRRGPDELGEQADQRQASQPGAERRAGAVNDRGGHGFSSLGRRSAIGESATGYRLLATGYRLPAIGRQRLTLNSQLLVGSWSPAARRPPPAIGRWIAAAPTERRPPQPRATSDEPRADSLSSTHPASVHEEHDAVHVVRRARREEDRRAGEIVGRAPAPGRDRARTSGGARRVPPRAVVCPS